MFLHCILCDNGLCHCASIVERTLDTFLQSAEFFRQLTENSDIRRIAANLNRLKLITEDQFRLLNAMPNKKEANEHFYDSLVKEKSFEKLEIFCNALQVDTTFENHQILKQMIRHFLNPGTYYVQDTLFD